MKTTSAFTPLAGLAAYGAALVGFLYSIAFVVLQNTLLASICLLAGGLLSGVAIIALFERLRETDPPGASVGLVFGAIAALGSAIHGGYDLAGAINPAGAPAAGAANLANPIDPRGLLTFGVAGLAVLTAGLLMRRHPQFGSGFTTLTFVLGVLLIVVYLARLIILEPSNPLVLVPAAITGFIVNPLWYALLGAHLRRTQSPAQEVAPVRG